MTAPGRAAPDVPSRPDAPPQPAAPRRRPGPSVRARFWLLTALRWFPTGLMIPVSVLLPLERGLSLAQVGAAMAAQGIVVLLLELPTGSLTDTLGRRPVFLASAAVAVVSLLTKSVATTFAGFAVAWALQGVFRALDSGPLEAWFVDAERAAGADRQRVARGLSSAGAVIGLAIAAGALVGGGLVAVAPGTGAATLAFPLQVAAGVTALQLVAAALLMTERRRPAGEPRQRWTGTLRDGLHMVVCPGALRRLAGVSALTAIGMVAFEVFMPVRLEEFTARATDAGAAMGPVTAAAWAASAVGAGLTALATRRLGVRTLSAVLLAAQAVAVVAMALAGGPAGLVAAFLAVYLVHVGAGTTFNALVHDEVADSHRATALSVMSLAAQGVGALANIGLGLVGEHAGPPAALLVGAAGTALGAALLTLRRRSRQAPRLPTAPPAPRPPTPPTPSSDVTIMRSRSSITTPTA